MKKALLIASILVVAVISTACINNIAVQELNNKAAEYMQKGDYESAVNRLQASLDLDPSVFQTYYNLGVAAIKANKFETAIEALEGGIKINPDFSDFYYSLAIAQIGLADELTENNDDEETDKTEDTEAADSDDNVSEEDKTKAINLRTSAIENLNKYLTKMPDAKDKEDILEMIKQSEEFISGDSPKEENP